MLAVTSSPSKSKLSQASSSGNEKSKDTSCSETDANPCATVKCGEIRSEKRRERDKAKTQEKNKRNVNNKTSIPETRGSEILVAEKHSPKTSDSAIVINTSAALTCNRISKKRNQKHDTILNCSSIASSTPVSSTKSITSAVSSTTHGSTIDTKCQNIIHNKHYKPKDILVNGLSNNSIADYNDFLLSFGQNASIKGKKNSIDKLSL